MTDFNNFGATADYWQQLAPISVTKMDAARRQLRTAIQVWFSDGDPVSIHTLVHAAHEVIHRLYRLAGHSDLLFDSKDIPAEHAESFSRFLKDPARFFKHAKIEKEVETPLEFDPGLNLLFIMLSIEGLRRMGEELDGESLAFVAWVPIHYPGIMPDDFIRQSLPAQVIQNIRTIGKSDFLKRFQKEFESGRIK